MNDPASGSSKGKGTGVPARSLFRIALAGAVMLAVAGGVFVALSETPPDPLPGVALGSPALFRIELGFASFAAFYLALVVVVNALKGFLIVRLGPKGAEFGDAVDMREREAATDLARGVRGVEGGLSVVATTLAESVRRLEREIAEIRKESSS